MEQKTQLEQWKEKLMMHKKNGLCRLEEDEILRMDEFCQEYKNFLNLSKTEREAVVYAVSALEKAGYVPFDSDVQYRPGDRVYFINRNKAVIAATFGKKKCAKGVLITAAHIDSPRLDLKPCPLYESKEMAYFKTHYYGGIKKYQWTAIPLALHGCVVKKDGSTVLVNLGEAEDDPQFCVTDLLPHLAHEQMAKPMEKAIEGEDLNVLIGSRPFAQSEESGAVKLNIMHLIFEKYGIIEEDFLSAELEVVPAFSARDIGFDRSMVGSYGQDDRVCGYTALQAQIDCDSPEYTTVTVLTDKEETGSDGNTGLHSSYLYDFIADLARLEGVEARDILRNSSCLSADVNAAYDPSFAGAFEENNSSFINYGVVITKYTGARGKSGTSDANAEFMGKVRSLLDADKVVWQIGELGKVDFGGGGTVAKYIANLDVDVVDVGVPVLSMHAPFEVVSKLDTYMAYRAFAVFNQQK